MKILGAKLLFLLTALVVCSAACPHTSTPESLLNHNAISGDLANALAEIAYASGIPLIGELSQPLPKINVPAGRHTLEYLLVEIRRQSPGYQFQREGKAIHFFDRRLLDAKFNFLSRLFTEFTMPSDLSDFKLTFPTLAIAQLSDIKSGGYAISGFGDSEFEKEHLQRTRLQNVVVREVLFRVANETPTFFSIIVFPDDQPTKTQAENVGVNWFWQSFRKPLEKLYIQPARRP